ncbi:MAG TPA: flagellar hook-basal body complex protein FliE [Gemmataceae bacterium]|nr:flagellar hook-basal body complex protein FliE [Gemmataceae bacterium]
MAIAPVSLPVLPDASAGSIEGSSSGTAGEAFTRILKDFLTKSATQQAQADQGIMDLAAGNTDNLHRVFLDVIKAELGTRMVLEVRNRLIESYQQVMQMQV